MRLLFAVLAIVHVTTGAKILAFLPFPMKSHHLAFQPTIRALAERGHDVTYFTSVPMDKPLPKNFRQIIIENNLREMFQTGMPGGSLTSFGTLSTPRLSATFCNIGAVAIDYALSHPEARKIIDSTEKYDLIIHEALFGSEAVIGLQHKFNALSVLMIPLADSAWINDIAGLTDNPSYMIDFKTHFTDQLSFFQRVHNVYHLAATLLVSYYKLGQMQEIMDKRLNYTGWETRPPIQELLNDMALILVNSHHSVGYSYPRAPQVKDVGGMNIRPFKPLPKDLEKILNDSPQGVIYFSFGSNLDMSKDSSGGIREAFTNVFAKLKQRVLWKWSAKTIPAVSKNVHISDWFPQQDILDHKNTKLFISHGGMLSTTEAVNSAVPIIGVPFFADQRKVLNQVQGAGYGIRLDQDNLTETSIMWAVTEILNNENYKKTALKHQALFRDRPMAPVEEGVYWIEYILRHGNVLKPASSKMPFYKLHSLDVLAFVSCVFIVALVVLKKLIVFVLTLCGIVSKKCESKKKKQ